MSFLEFMPGAEGMYESQETWPVKVECLSLILHCLHLLFFTLKRELITLLSLEWKRIWIPVYHCPFLDERESSHPVAMSCKFSLHLYFCEKN